MTLSIKDMAKKIGVSVATVSRALNPETRSKVAPATLERVDRLVAKYGYMPNQAARNLRKASTKTIGVIFPYVENIFYSSYYTHILAGVANALLDTEYQFKMLLLKDEKDKWDRYNFSTAESVDGLIVTQWFRFFSDKEVLSSMNIPTVVINDFEEGVRAQFVCCDNIQGGEAAADFLYSQGHRKIGLITGPAWSRDSRQRQQGFQGALKRVGHAIGSQAVQQGDYDDPNVTRQALEKLLKYDPEISAIFCCNDNIAFMVIDELKQKNISCPEQISVVGFDDDFRALHFNPPLTTIQMPVYGLAKESVRLLLDHLRSGNPSSSFMGNVLLKPQIIERQSVTTL